MIDRIKKFWTFIKRLTRREVVFESSLSPEQFKLKLSQRTETKGVWTTSLHYVGEVENCHFKIKATFFGESYEGEIMPKLDGSMIRMRIRGSFLSYFVYAIFCMALSVPVIAKLVPILERYFVIEIRGIVKLLLFFSLSLLFFILSDFLSSVDRASSARLE